MPYLYTEVDWFRCPPSYSYADYGGRGFLDEYVEDRLTRLNERFDSPCSFERSGESHWYQVIHELCNGNAAFPPKRTERYFDNSRVFTKPESACLERHKIEFAADIHTANLMRALLHSLTCDGAGIAREVSESLPWCELLVKRFEVSKKIYENYGAALRKGYGEATNIYLYEQFALILSLIYLRTNRLSFLSALLKVNDLLLSTRLVQLSDQGEGSGAVALAVAVELHAVQNLARIQGVTLNAE